ncbi:unnamed protein product [Phytophthora fragariaefolia]|uniref:Histone-lysine N-methyltransferase, H3 lysine-79 specific n=1 Tax=Phytophthora fragariaefolia TaxID=1490495 RepID=A0A9W6Y557_9STRA|nr:unnamed protein product [Phytophthora fragariaefolia]
MGDEDPALRQGATQRQQRAAARFPTPAPAAPPTAPASSAPLALPASSTPPAPPARPEPPETPAPPALPAAPVSLVSPAFSSLSVPPAPSDAPASPASSAYSASQSQSASAHDEDPVTSLLGDSSSLSSSGVSAEERTPPMSSSTGERVVTAVFAEVPYVVVQGANKMPHRNAGELMPCGISSLLRELGGLCETDVFLDIGSGVGNVVEQVVLATNVAKALGVEVHQDLNDLGMKTIAKSVNSK